MFQPHGGGEIAPFQVEKPLPTAATRRTRIPWNAIVPIALVLLILLAFLPALMADFVDWDDDDLLFKTTQYRALDFQSFKWMFVTSYAGHFQPLTWLSYALDWHLWGRNAFGYHLTSVLLHATTAIIVYVIARRLMRAAAESSHGGADVESVPRDDLRLTACAALAAVIFAVHPLRAESVAWLSERRDVLGGLFYAAAVAAWLRYASCHSRRRAVPAYGATVFFQFLSLLSKASAATLPAVLLILDVYPLRRRQRKPGGAGRTLFRLLLEKTPFVILGAIGASRAIRTQSEAGAMYPLAEYDLLSRFAQACYGLAFYIGKTVWPVGLGPLYQIPPRETLLGPMFLLSAVFVVLLAILAVGLRNRVPAVTAATLAYAVILAPVLGFFQSGPQLVADRYSYLACVGFSLLPPAGVYVWSRRRPFPDRRRDAALLVAGATLVTALFHATAGQSKIWSSSLHLWARGVEVDPNSSIAHANLADVLAAVGNLPSAAWHYRRSLELQPRDPITARHFADTLVRLGDFRLARFFYERALALEPGRADVRLSLARTLMTLDDPRAALEVLRRALRESPSDLPAAELLCTLLTSHPDQAVHNDDEAFAVAEAVVRANGESHVPSLLLQATTLARADRLDQAADIAQRALDIADRNGDDRLARDARRRLRIIQRLITARDAS